VLLCLRIHSHKYIEKEYKIEYKIECSFNYKNNINKIKINVNRMELNLNTDVLILLNYYLS